MGGICRPQFLAEQTAQQGDQGNADQSDTTASHELFYPQLVGTSSFPPDFSRGCSPS